MHRQALYNVRSETKVVRKVDSNWNPASFENLDRLIAQTLLVTLVLAD
jgi:hypothetical protein